MDGPSAARWQRVDALFAELLDVEPASRRAYLARVSDGDVALEREVLSLLASLDTAEAAIGESADALLAISGPLVDAAEPALAAGTRVGPYAIRHELGRGGMGTVYCAARVDGDFRRDVALKVMRTAHDSAALRRRFAAERRILGTLEHPHIARLYDSGVTEDGRPFLAMELVEGTRIDRWADAQQLDVRARVLLVETVCDAVAFAHQRLVVHRDLKPANVLVSEAGRVMLLDFGIAKLLDVDEADAVDAPATRPGQRVLTPEYASPEQARGEAPDVAMDVYALGVLLHELLTGVRPPWQRLVVSGADHAIIEAAMVPPSRTATTSVVQRALRGDLDTVVLTALRPTRAERYPSVAALRDDLRRVREGFPILAQRPTVFGRVRKFMRRHPGPVAAAVLLVTVSAAFSVNLRTQVHRAELERDRANVERDRADGEQRRATRTASLLTELFGSADPFASERRDTLRASALLAVGMARVNSELREEPAVRADLLLVIGKAFRSLGRFDEAQAALDTARLLRERTPGTTAAERAAVLNMLGVLALDRQQIARSDSLFRASLAEREAFAASMEAQSDATASTSLDVRSLGDSTRAEPVRVARLQVAKTLASVATSHLEANRFDSALVYIDSARTQLLAFTPVDSTALANVYNVRGAIQMRMGQPTQALADLRESVALNEARLGPTHPSTVRDRSNVGMLLNRLGRPAEAEPLLREGLEQLRTSLPDDHPGVRSIKLALGNTWSALGRLDEAERLLREVVEVERRLEGSERRALGISLDNLAGVMTRRTSDPAARRETVEPLYREAAAVSVALGGDADPGGAITLAKAANVACRGGGDATATLQEFEQAVAIVMRAYGPVHPHALGVRANRAWCLAQAGRHADAIAELQTVFEAARQHGPDLRGLARQSGGELLSLLRADNQTERASEIAAALDALAAPAARPSSPPALR